MKRLLALFLLFATAAAYAGGAVPDKVKQALHTLAPGKEPSSISATPIAGLYQVAYGPRIYYVSGDGRFLIKGDLIDMKERVNITSRAEAAGRLVALSEVPESSMIVYPATGKHKYTVTVFTDIDCPYCRKLHSQMKQYNDLGIEVRYMAFPRAGIGSHSYDKAVSVWCAKDRRSAMDSAKHGKEPKPATCVNPVKAEMAIGALIGVEATPTMVLQDGSLVPGYAPPKQLLSMLEQK